MGQKTEELFVALMELMKQHEVLFERLLQVGGTQQDALRTNNIELLDSAVSAINELTGQLDALEERRLGVQSAAELHLGLPEDSSMQVLLQFAPVSLRGELEACRKLLRYSTERFIEMININQTLIKNAIRFNNHMFKIMLPQEDTYCGDGTLTGAGRRDMLVNKTI